MLVTLGDEGRCTSTVAPDCCTSMALLGCCASTVAVTCCTSVEAMAWTASSPLVVFDVLCCLFFRPRCAPADDLVSLPREVFPLDAAPVTDLRGAGGTAFVEWRSACRMS